MVGNAQFLFEHRVYPANALMNDTFIDVPSFMLLRMSKRDFIASITDESYFVDDLACHHLEILSAPIRGGDY